MGDFSTSVFSTFVDPGSISFEQNSSAPQQTELILTIPEEERTYAALVKPETPSSQVVVKEEVVDQKPPSRRSIRAKTKSSPSTSEKAHTFIHVEDDKSERKSSTSPKMSKTSSGDVAKSSLAPSAEDLLRRAKTKRSSSESSQLPPARPKAPSESATKIQKKPRTINLPEGFCNYSQGISSIKPHLPQFLFPDTEDYLKNFKPADILAESSTYNLMSMQGMMTVKKHVTALQARLDRMKHTKATSKEKAAADTKAIAALTKRNDELKEYATKKKGDVLDSAGYYTWKTRSELMKDFAEGYTADWKAQEDIKNWEENFANTVPSGAEDDFELDA